MGPLEQGRVESETLHDFAREMHADTLSLSERLERRPGLTARLELNPEKTRNGLGRLVLTLVKVLHELLERQAIRRIDAGSLSDHQVERLGLALMRQAEEIERLRKEFGLEVEDLNLDLGPVGRLL
jgi:gas vesicle protein GvpK